MDIPEDRGSGYDNIVLPGTLGSQKSNKERLQDQVRAGWDTDPADGASAYGGGFFPPSDIQPEEAAWYVP